VLSLWIERFNENFPRAESTRWFSVDYSMTGDNGFEVLAKAIDDISHNSDEHSAQLEDEEKPEGQATRVVSAKNTQGIDLQSLLKSLLQNPETWDKALLGLHVASLPAMAVPNEAQELHDHMCSCGSRIEMIEDPGSRTNRHEL